MTLSERTREIDAAPFLLSSNRQQRRHPTKLRLGLQQA